MRSVRKYKSKSKNLKISNKRYKSKKGGNLNSNKKRMCGCEKKGKKRRRRTRRKRYKSKKGGAQFLKNLGKGIKDAVSGVFGGKKKEPEVPQRTPSQQELMEIPGMNPNAIGETYSAPTPSYNNSSLYEQPVVVERTPSMNAAVTPTYEQKAADLEAPELYGQYPSFQ